MQALIVLVLIGLLLALIGIWVGFAAEFVLTSRYELKRRAQDGERQAKVIYGLTINGREVLIAMLLGGVLAASLVVLLLNSLMLDLLAAIVATGLICIFGILVPFIYGRSLSLNLVTWLAPLAERILRLLRPVARPISKRVDQVIGMHSILYSKDQLLAVIDDHTKLPYSDVSVDEAKLVRNSLTFGSRKIVDVMVPRKVVDMVSVDDEIGPVEMDELHKSGHSRFPVFDPQNNDQIVGMLYLRELVGERRSGPVKKLMSPKVFFVHEELDLDHALDAFIKTKHHLFIVVNTFEEFVGLLTIEDVLEQIIGRQIVDEFDAYENLREVALLRAKKDRAKNNHVK